MRLCAIYPSWLWGQSCDILDKSYCIYYVDYLYVSYLEEGIGVWWWCAVEVRKSRDEYRMWDGGVCVLSEIWCVLDEIMWIIFGCGWWLNVLICIDKVSDMLYSYLVMLRCVENLNSVMIFFNIQFIKKYQNFWYYRRRLIN